MRFAKKHKKGLKKMQANKAKAMSARAKVKPKISKAGSHKLIRLVYMAHPKLRTRAHVCITKGLRLCWPKSKAKAQTKPQALAAAAAQAPKGAQAPMNAPE
ncbi:PREDICTED: 60S ribosomal protein L29-like [Miniopterus natalensis]|uniref:60S ribosomal protein L29-like n=1 Tax=Miniopterus natalensis TaxID=291302 RepID=UPI0007A6FE7B|nr:PREDICTED: 60S ribosomal protein L29-like [Miniopterus natalensis]